MFSLDHIARSLSFKRNDNFSFYQCKPKFCSMTWFSTGFDLGKELNEIIISFVFFCENIHPYGFYWVKIRGRMFGGGRMRGLVETIAVIPGIIGTVL